MFTGGRVAGLCVYIIGKFIIYHPAFDIRHYYSVIWFLVG